MKGKFIVIDGTDGSGKQTQTSLLLSRIKAGKKKVEKIDFPCYDSNLFGKLLFEALKEGKHGDFIAVSPKIASAIYAADRFESSGAIRKLIDKGVVVLADRYVSANQIHQGGKIKEVKARREFLKWLDDMEYGVFKIPRPDVIVYLHVPLEVSLELIRKRALEAGQKPDQAESDARHLLESQESALAIVRGNNNWIRINCAKNGVMRTRESISDEIFTKLKKKKII